MFTRQSGTDEVGRAGQWGKVFYPAIPSSKVHGGHSVNTEEQCSQAALYLTVRGLSHAAQSNVHTDLLQILLKCRL